MQSSIVIDPHIRSGAGLGRLHGRLAARPAAGGARLTLRREGLAAWWWGSAESRRRLAPRQPRRAVAEGEARSTGLRPAALARRETRRRCDLGLGGGADVCREIGRRGDAALEGG